jgi:hypothetical protein
VRQKLWKMEIWSLWLCMWENVTTGNCRPVSNWDEWIRTQRVKTVNGWISKWMNVYRNVCIVYLTYTSSNLNCWSIWQIIRWVMSDLWAMNYDYNRKVTHVRKNLLEFTVFCTLQWFNQCNSVALSWFPQWSPEYNLWAIHFNHAKQGIFPGKYS